MERQHTVLVIDDEPNVVKSVHDLLRLECRVLGATSGQEGMDILSREEVHVIMSDQRMPGMTGVEFLHHIRGKYSDAVRIIFTGYADVQAVIDAINEGHVFRYIVKPWDPAELLGVIRDACERYDLIVDRRRLLGELQDKNRELETAIADLREADGLKHTFVQVAGHELRTPLSIVLMLAHMALQTPGLVEGTRDQLLRIERAARRLEYLIKQMDTVLSARRFNYRLNLSSVDLGQLLRQAAEEVRPFVDMRHHVLVLDVADDLGSLSVDPLKVHDTITQLLMNAVKFTPDQGRIVLSARRNGDDGVEVRVSDTGVGIEAQGLLHVFDPFFTGAAALNHSSGTYEFGRKGLGLGLCAVKAFVEMHGGRIAVESKVNHGTTSTFNLPARRAAAPAMAAN